MVSTSRAWLALALAGALLAVQPAGRVSAQAKKEDKKDVKRVTFKTHDGVELNGTYYPSPGGSKKDATVLFLHDFDPKAGGNSHKGGTDKFAERLQTEGYSVLTFDFRGFGESKTVDPAFWRNKTNALQVKMKSKGETIDHKDFQLSYYPNLAQDVAAAKAFLDRKNDARELNSGNVIVIGAGQGATVGSMWLASQCRLRRDTAVMPLPLAPPGMLADPEAKDIACAVWLSISPRLGHSDVGGRVKQWTRMAARDQKVPMAFVYGSNDTKGDNFAKELLKNINAGAKLKLDYTGEKSVDGNSGTGVDLLGSATERWIMKDYLAPVLEKRGSKEWTERRLRESRFYYAIPLNPSNPNGPAKRTLAKQAGEEVPVVDMVTFFGR